MTGTTISHYRILEKLGEGGMGVVYKAVDTSLDRIVALKFLPPLSRTSEKNRQRFIREAKAAAALNHPHICTIYSVETHEDQQFIAMEYVEGTTLREKMQETGTHLQTVVRYAVQMVDALSAAHEQGIVHRDIKPENIMVDRRDCIKVMDFGLARMKGSQKLTREAGVMGTVAYMSPEQVQGGDVDERSDLFSFGIVLYEMMTGTHPFLDEYEQATVFRLVNEDPQPPGSINPDVPPGLEDIAVRCLEKDRELRYRSARDIEIELKGEEQWPLKRAFTNMSSSYRQLVKPRRFGRRALAWISSIGLLLVSLGILQFYPTDFWGDSRESMPDEKHIVVLPFTNLSEDRIPASLNDGIMEILTSKITQMEIDKSSLWVVPSSEVRSQQITSVTEASRLFGANMAVTGSLQREGNHFRLTINLIDGTTMRQLHSEMLDMEWTDLTGLQDEVVRTLTAMLQVELTPETVDAMMAGGSLDPGAYQLYIQGRGFLSRYEKQEFVELAIQKFREAIEADPEYVHAYAGLAEAYWRKFDLTHDVQWAKNSLEYGNKALDMGGRIPEVYTTMALINNGMSRSAEALNILANLSARERLGYEALIQQAQAHEGLGQLEDAEAAYRQAVRQKKSYWGAHNQLGAFYYRYGRMEEAALEFRKVTELTPDNYRAFNNLGSAYFGMKRAEDAVKSFRRSLDIQPNAQAFSNLGTFYYYRKDYTEASRMYEQAAKLVDTDYRWWAYLGYAYYWAGEDTAKVHRALRKAVELAERERRIRPDDPGLLSELAHSHAMLGNTDHGRKLLRELISLEVLDPETEGTIAYLYEQLGDRDSALHWVEVSLRDGYRLSVLESLEGMEALMKDPRMAKLRKKYDTENP